MESRNLLMDDVELFVNDNLAAVRRTSGGEYKSPSSATSNDLRDVFIFDEKPFGVEDVPTDNLLGFADWNSTLTPGGSAKKVDNAANWPAELPSVSVENYVRSNRSSSSTTATMENQRESLDKLINHVPLLPPRPPAAVPPRINKSSTKPVASNGKLPNGAVLFSNHKSSCSNDNSSTHKGFDDDDVDEDDEDDVDEDDVFLRLQDSSTSKPLINVSKKKVRFLDGSVRNGEDSQMRVGSDDLVVKRGRSCRYALIRVGYLLVANAALAAIVCAIIYLPSLLRSTRRHPTSSTMSSKLVVQCRNFSMDYIDNYTFSQYYITSDVQRVNLTNDRRLSVVFGFGFYSNMPCGDSTGRSCERRGGVLAFDVKNGVELWKVLTLDEITGVNCREDVDADAISDCAISGRSGIMKMISGRNAVILWEFASINGRNKRVLTPQWVSDKNSDGIADVLLTVNLEADDNNEMSLYLLSGKTGTSLTESAETLISIRSMLTENAALIWRHGDAALDEILWPSGTLKLTGGLNLFSLRALVLGKIETNQILYTNSSVIGRPVFGDVNADGFTDVVICSLSGEVIAYSGALPHKPLWRYVRTSSQCTSLLFVGSFHNEKRLDIVVTFNVGGGFPNYNSYETYLLNGINGLEIERLFSSPLPVSSNSLVVNMKGVGNDLYLTSKSSCETGLDESLNAAFSSMSAPQNMRELSAVDFCGQLFDSKSLVQLLAVRKSFNVQLMSSSNGVDRMFKFTSQLNDFIGNSGVDLSSMLPQLGRFSPVEVSSDGSTLTILVPTFWTSSTDTLIFPKECFKSGRDFLSPDLLSPKCRDYIERREKRRRIGYTENSVFSGLGILHKINLRCQCDPKLLKETETCSTFLLPT